MPNRTKIQPKITRGLFLLCVLFFFWGACISSSDKNGKATSNELPIILKNPKNSNKINKNITPGNIVHLIAEQDSNGIFWGLRDTVTGKLVLNYTYQEIWNFKGDFATVMLNDKFGLINKSGKAVIEPREDSPVKMEIKCGCVTYESANGMISISDTNGRLIMPLTSGITGILPCQKRITLGDYGYGMINFKGDTILPFKFREAYLLPEGFCIASLYDNDLYGLYDLNGKQVLPHVFEKIDGFYYKRAIVKKNGSYGVIDETGKELFYTDYGSIDRFTNYYALVYTKPKDGVITVGIINKNGKVVIPPIYQWLEYAGNFNEGLAPMALNRKYGFLDTTGKIIVQFKYDKVEFFKNGIAKVWKGWQHVGYINNKGIEIIPPDFDAMDQANLKTHYNRFIIGLKNSVQHVFNYSGKEIAILNYNTISEFNENEKSWIVSINNKFGILDSNFQVRIPVKYESLKTIFPGKIAARDQGKIGFINQDGKSLSTFKYDSVEPFQSDNVTFYENGLAKVGINEKKGLINSYGKIIVPIIYDEIQDFSHSLAIIKRNGKYGFVNFRGKEVIPAIYNSANTYDGYTAKVTLKRKSFEIDSSGKKVDEDID